MCFLRNGSSYSFETCTVAIGMTWNTSGFAEFGPLNIKESDVLAQNVVSQETDHHTTLKLVPWLQLTCLKTSGCAEFGPLNTKESNVLAQNVFSQKMDHHKALKLVPLQLAPENFRVCWVWHSKYEGKWCFSPKFSQKWIIIQALKPVPLNWHTWSGCALCLAL